MSNSNSSLTSTLGAHARTFVLAIAVGAIVALGVRSLFHDATGEAPTANAAENGDAHHAAAGHEGHAHPDDATAPDEKAGQEGHGGREMKDGTETPPKETPPEKTPEEKTHDGQAAPNKPQGVLLELGNTDCPVMGGEVNGKTFTEWNGLRVGHCCPGCQERFLKNPESLLDEVSPGWRAAAAAAKAIDAATGKERAKLLVGTGKTWNVLREPSAAAPKQAPAGLLVDLGNTDCPVMGGKVDGKTFTEWRGLRVGHCCPGCGKRFLKDPQTLLDEVAPEWRKALAAVEAVHAARGEPRAKALTVLRKQWKVVREPLPEKRPGGAD